MFAFFQLNERDYGPKEIEFDAITIIGINNSIDNYQNNSEPRNYFHWIYGNCNNDSDTEGKKELITPEIIKNGACIRKFYDKIAKKYYDTNDSGFEWPVVKQGISSKKNQSYYGIIVEKCRNNTFKTIRDGRDCKSDEYINSYMTNRFIIYSVLDQFSDVLNYKNPITSYIFQLSNGITDKSDTINHLNFVPLTVRTHNGIIFDNIVEDYSYMFY